MAADSKTKPAEAHHRAQPRQTSAELSLQHKAEQTTLSSAGEAVDRKPADFNKRFLKLNELSVPNQRRFKRTPYAGAELGKFDLTQQILKKASDISDYR